jgi:hypothetical protein
MEFILFDFFSQRKRISSQRLASPLPYQLIPGSGDMSSISRGNGTSFTRKPPSCTTSSTSSSNELSRASLTVRISLAAWTGSKPWRPSAPSMPSLGYSHGRTSSPGKCPTLFPLFSAEPRMAVRWESLIPTSHVSQSQAYRSAA